MPYQWQFESIAWGGSQFVAVGRVVGQAIPLELDRALIATSPDGVTWTERTAPAAAKRLRDVVWSGDRFVAVGDGILTSSDGVTWSAPRLPVGGEWTAVTWAESQFVAVGWKSGLITSRDGIRWLERGARNASFHDVAWSGRQFVAVELTMIFTSPDGVTWSAPRLPTAYFQNAVTWGDSQFVAVGAGIAEDFELHEAIDVLRGESGLVELDTELLDAARGHGDHGRVTLPGSANPCQ